jgi:3-phosphoshikimate 1-carboxyvinyltransferase
MGFVQLTVNGSSGALSGELVVPVSKYHAHRALVLASLAPGRSVIRGLSETRQIVWTVGVLRALGTRIEVQGDDYVVHGGAYDTSGGVIDHGSISAEGLLNVGSSGTTLYFMTGLAALADRPVTLTGMKYFRRRPIQALLDSLSQLGIRHESADGCPPITVFPGRPEGGRTSIPGTLSQWLSGLLLVAPFARRTTTIEVTGPLNERPYVDLTVRMMRHFGLEVDASPDGRTFVVPAGQTARPADYTVPPDIGSAAFGLAATALHPSDVLFHGLHATRASETDHPEADFLDIVSAMGLPLTRDAATGCVRVRHDGIALKPVELDCSGIPDLLPVVSALAAFADGRSELREVAHIRLKESDRVKAMLQLNRLGARLSDQGSSLVVDGLGASGSVPRAGAVPLRGAAMSSYNDHRVLMSLAVAATRAEGESRLTYPHAYRISYPRFLDAMNDVGLEMGVRPREAAAGTEPGR